MQSFLKSGSLASSSSSGTSKKKQTQKRTPWVEKYRPRTISDVVEQEEVVAVMKRCLDGADLPNLLFYGPPGTGKTSTILAAARQLFGDLMRDRILELNASDERGIDVIREKVKNFAQLTASATRPDGKPCPPFKIIILDEADSITHAAQAALRRTMEKETKSTRFCLICNFISRIIEPLTSRCSKFRFKPLKAEMVLERLQFICKEEDVKYEKNALETLIETSGGDMRLAINCLQSCAEIRIDSAAISVENVLEVNGVVPKKYFDEFLQSARDGNPKSIQPFVQNLLWEAYSIAQFLDGFDEFIINHPMFNDMQKSMILKKIAEISHRLEEGASEYIQLFDLGCVLGKAITSK